VWSFIEGLAVIGAVAGAAAVLYTGQTIYAAVCILMPFVLTLASRLREASLRKVSYYLNAIRNDTDLDTSRIRRECKVVTMYETLNFDGYRTKDEDF
jgi:hypothetical protein